MDGISAPGESTLERACFELFEIDGNRTGSVRSHRPRELRKEKTWDSQIGNHCFSPTRRHCGAWKETELIKSSKEPGSVHVPTPHGPPWSPGHLAEGNQREALPCGARTLAPLLPQPIASKIHFSKKRHPEWQATVYAPPILPGYRQAALRTGRVSRVECVTS